MSSRPTIADVAEAAGVSVSTVSKAVNGRYGVGSATAERIRLIAQELGYASSLTASSMRAHRTGVVGVLVGLFEPFSTEVLRGVQDALRSTDAELLAWSGGPDHAGWERRSLGRLAGTLIDGAILITPTVVDVRTDIPVVAVDPHTGPAHLPMVASDSFEGGRAATAHLVGLGHRRIGLIGGRQDLQSARLREAGYRRALEDAGIPVDPALVVIGGYLPEQARAAAVALLARPDRPTAVFAANDASAVETIRVAHEQGIDVPHGLSVVGFDDVPEAARHAPPLTTVSQSMHRMGEDAARLLMDLLAGRQPAVTRVVLPTRLVVRGTTAPPRA